MWWFAVEANALETKLVNRVIGDRSVYQETLEESQDRILGVGFRPPDVLDAMTDRATAEERKNELFPAVTSRFPEEALARLAVRRFRLSEMDVKRLQKIHELHRAGSFEDSDAREQARSLSFSLAVVTLIASLVPRQFFSSDYWFGVFRLCLILALGVSLMLLALWWFITRSSFKRRYARAKLIERLLDYCEIVVDGDGAQPARQT